MVVLTLMIIAWEIYIWITIGNFLHIMKNEGKIMYGAISLVKIYFWDGGNVYMNKFSYVCFHFPFVELKMHVTKIIRDEV